MLTRTSIALLALLSCLLSLLAGCEQRMNRQPRYQPLEAADQFPDGRAARHPPPGTIAQDAGDATQQRPLPLTRADIQRGGERYAIYCVPCHGILGEGNGPVVQRGFAAPPSYHTARLRQAPVDYLYQIISEGYGDMYAYADRVTPADRWRIAYYIQALQQSQHTDLNKHPQLRTAFEQGMQADGPGEAP